MLARWRLPAAVAHSVQPLEPQSLLVLLRELVLLQVRSALQQVPQLPALPPEEPDSMPQDLEQTQWVSPQPALELQEREQPQEAPQALQLLAGEPASMPPLSRNAPLPRRPLPVLLRLLTAREPSPLLPRSRNWNAFSFPLHQNPAAGQ